MIPDIGEAFILIPLINVKETRNGRGKLIRVNNLSIAVFNHNGKFYAIDNFCPHQGGDLADGYIRNGNVYCPLHHWSFNLKTGAYSFNENMKIKTYHTEIRDDIIFIDVAD